MSNSQSILLIEPDPLLRSFVLEKLAEMGCDVDVANGFEEAQDLQKKHHYDLVLRDLPKPFSLGVLEWRLKSSRISRQPKTESLPVSA